MAFSTRGARYHNLFRETHFTIYLGRIVVLINSSSKKEITQNTKYEGLGKKDSQMK